MTTPATDWNAIRNRLAALAESVSGGFEPDPEETKRILRARARAAAKPPAKPDDTERLEILAFTLARETYGVETCHVREVCPLKDLTPIPCTPSFIAGVMNLRSQVLTIVDLRRFFDLPVKGLTELNRIIILRGGDNEFGLLVDAIEGIRYVAVSELQGSLPTLLGIREKYLRGITGQLLVVLDGGLLLGDAGFKVNEQVMR